MKVNTKKLSDKQIELDIEIPAPQMEAYFQLAASELSKNMKIKGFRPGKIPIEIVEREQGSQKIYDQTANIAVQGTLAKAVIEENIEVIGRPDIVITQIARGNSMKYKATFWIIPEIDLGVYKGLKVKKKELKVKDEEIDKTLEHLQRSRAKLITVNRPAKKGDRVEIEFITRSNGVKIEGGENKNYPLIIGESRFLPGFEKKLEAMKSGDKKIFSLTAPKDWPQKNLAGQKLDFEITINLVQERQIPKLSDDFAKSLGNFKSIEDLKRNVRENLFQEKETKEKERIRMELIDTIIGASKIEIPDVLIDIELEKMLNELKDSIQNMGLEFDKYLFQIKKTVDDLKKEWREQAEKRAKTGLILKDIAKKEEIKVTEKELEDRTNEILKYYSNIQEVEKNLDPKALKLYTEEVIRNEKVFELLEKEAKII